MYCKAHIFVFLLLELIVFRVCVSHCTFECANGCTAIPISQYSGKVNRFSLFISLFCEPWFY